MKMSILEIGYKNIRRITELKLSFTKDDGSIIKNSFVMMANGTGKTTTIDLIRGLLDGEAANWPAETVRSYAPKDKKDISDGEFYISVKFDDKLFKYFLGLNYKLGAATIETLMLAENGGREAGRRLPEAIRDIFTSEFVRRFVFDGEQAVKSMDSDSNEAEDTIKYLYRLDKLDEIISLNQQILIDIQNAEGNQGSSRSLNVLRTKQAQVKDTLDRLNQEKNRLQRKIKKNEDEKKIKVEERNKIDRNNSRLNQEKNRIMLEQNENSKDIDAKIAEILNLIKSPYLVNEELCERMKQLGTCMTKLKLPKTISKDFFIELADETTCVCGRCINKKEKETILMNAERYLGSDHQAVLNVIKSSLMHSTYDSRLNDAFEQLSDLKSQANILDNRFKSNEDKLLKAGGHEAKELQNQIEELSENITTAKAELNRLKSTDEFDERLSEKNNIHRAKLAYKEYEQKIAAVTRTNTALRKKDIIEAIVNEIRKQATEELKLEIIRKTNEKLQKVIADDYIEIENIDHYIKLKGRDGASEGQTLSIAYCFLGTLFEDAELEFPFVIDSPTGKMDFEKRKAVADIIPDVFNQVIAFVQSAEVENFADRFYENTDAQYLTIIVSRQGNNIEVHNGKEFFDSYQREHKGDEK